MPAFAGMTGVAGATCVAGLTGVAGVVGVAAVVGAACVANLTSVAGVVGVPGVVGLTGVTYVASVTTMTRVASGAGSQRQLAIGKRLSYYRRIVRVRAPDQPLDLCLSGEILLRPPLIGVAQPGSGAQGEMRIRQMRAG